MESLIYYLEVDDAIKLNEKATHFTDGRKISSNILKQTLYIVEVTANGYRISRTLKGDSIGEVLKDEVKLINSNGIAKIKPYIVRIEQDKLPVYLASNTKSTILNYLNKNNLYTIINEENGFGKLLKGKGWIQLSQVKSAK